MPNFRSIGPFKQKLQRGGGRICSPLAIPICKKPGLFRVKWYHSLVIRGLWMNCGINSRSIYKHRKIQAIKRVIMYRTTTRAQKPR